MKLTQQQEVRKVHDDNDLLQDEDRPMHSDREMPPQALLLKAKTFVQQVTPRRQQH